MKQEIIEGNKLIAEFMGLPKVEGYENVYRINDGKPNWYSTEPKYNESWDWIMPVVDKIKELKHPIYLYQSHIQSTVEIFEMKNDHYIIRESDTLSKPIEVLFRALVNFIEIYNKEKK